MVAPSPKSCASPTLCRLGGIYIGPRPLPAFSCSGRPATGKDWRTQSQSSWKALARRIEPAIDRSPQRIDATNGEQARLSVEQAHKFGLVINLAAVKVLGVRLPPTLLAADEVIE
jgi:hypothetical protein